MKAQTAIKLLLGMQVPIVLFHLCILFKVIPYDITWGGRLTNDTEMYTFEIISISIITLLCGTLLMRGGYVKQFVSQRFTSIVLWIFFVLFALNTVGNLLAATLFEKFFSLLTLLSCVLLWFILRAVKKAVN